MIPTDRLHELDHLAAEVAESVAEDGMTWADASSCPTGLDQDYIAAFDPTTARAVIAELLGLRAQRDKVLALADWHETKADKARRYPGPGAANKAIMTKAAFVHDDAARRIRRALSITEEADRV